MKYLEWDETLFRDPEVFDPDYLPEEYLHREQQLLQLSSNFKPAFRKTRPINTLCLGPPGTGKTTAVKLLFREIESVSNEIIPIYVNCQIINSKQQVFARIFEKVHGYALPSYGVPFSKVYYSIMKKVVEGEKVLIVALDDVNFLLDDAVMNEVLYALLRAHEEVEGIKLGVVGIATDVKLAARLDERVGSIFHPDEVLFPLYGREEIHDILASRAMHGFYSGVLSEDAFERIVDLTYESSDLRFGIYLLKMSGLEAERRASRRIEIEDVEKVYEGGKRIFLRKSISALSEEERELLKLIYTSEEITTGELYKAFKDRANIGYTKFYEMLSKLESIRLVDMRFDQKGKGRTRVILKRYDPKIVLEAIKEF
jgi:cell division control protein 6